MSVSVVIPCLNEEGSIEECIRLVKAAFSSEDALEIIVADNGSTDSSRLLAEKAGAKVVDERRQGYGSAILRGLREASCDYIVIGDADNTYDFRDAALMVAELKKGADFAIGDRIHGQVDAGAMPWLHQKFGTPALTWVLNQFFGCRVHDINCGLRVIRRDCVERLRLRSPGMEFASEMVIHAQKAGLKFAEIPIRYYRRHHGQAKLRTFRDGWRHLRFILLCAPFPLYFIPAATGAIVSGVLYTEPRLGFQVMASLLNLAAFQILIFGILAKSYLWVADSFLVDRKFGKAIEKFRLEYGILAALLFLFFGVLLVRQFDISNLIRGSALLALSCQVFFSSFLLSTIIFKKQELS
jgi:glycosyltransferase involved in cell wall biosynthesis